jgi:hypothetical protein
MENGSEKLCIENQNTHFLINKYFFENRAVCDIMWKKTFEAGQATDDNMAHTLCMLDNYGYKHTLTICYTYCFSTATIFARARLNVTLYVHGQSC